MSIDLRANCVTQYKMNDNAASTVVVDSQGFSNGTAQQNTSALHTTGKVGGALMFNGTSDCIDTGNTFQSIWQNSNTITFWAELNSKIEGSDEISFFYYLFGGSGNRGMQYLYDTDYLYVNFTVGSDSLSVNVNPSLEVGVWYLFTIIVKKESDATASLYLYLNNTLLGSYENKPCVMTDWMNSNNFPLGMDWQGDFFNGSLDNIIIFNKALSTDEIAFFYNNGAGTEALTDIIPPVNTNTKGCVKGVETIFASQYRIDGNASR